MSTTPTQNPVPSESPADLKFNAGKIDEFVTSFLLEYTDRLGRQHLTIEGLRDTVEKAIKEFGFITMDSFEDGATLDNSSQVLRWESNGEYYRWDGSFPKVVPAGSTPASTGGIGAGAWVSIGDASARQLITTFISSLADTSDIAKGDALIGVKQPFTGTIGRTQHSVNSERRSVLDFPGTWDGVADDTVGFQAAVNSFGLIGGTLHIPNIAKVYLAGAVTIPGGVSISGDMKCPGAPGLPHLLGNIFKLGSQIRINPAITVSLGGGNAINNVVITRSTMTGPEVNAANYTGTAFTQIAADVRFESIICVGFTHLISCTGFARTVLNKSGIDTVGGVYVKDAGDPPEATNNHFWPYGTASASGAITTPDTNHFIYRSGAGLYFENCAWPLVSGNFILGHSDQGIAKDCSNPRVFGNGFSGINLGDVSPYVLGSTGFRVEGTTNNSAIDANVSVHLEHGIYLNSTDVNGRQTVTNQVCRNVKTTGVVVLGGNASIQANVEGRIASSAGVRVIGVNSKVLIDGCQLYNNLNGIQAEGALHKIGDNTFIGNATNILETADPFSIAAVTANMGTIPDKDYYYVTGAVSNIASFRDTFNGHEITMTFASACTLVNTGNLRISGSPLSIAAGASIKFVCLGKSGSRTWRQLTAPL
ncbi:hypothetical protein ACRBEJ_08875 [Yersinia proxima]|uniref:tail fiber/spike domain-containing protein n=1 Tax=Yersinia proxima TaxID=2890316 RepID=UPI003D692525